MTREIFSDYIKKLNNYFREQNRKILLVMNNLSGHLINEPSNIEFCFLPPNTMSLTQPLDQGIIHSFKSIYKFISMIF